jgi:hypothetical protein
VVVHLANQLKHLRIARWDLYFPLPYSPLLQPFSFHVKVHQYFSLHHTMLIDTKLPIPTVVHSMQSFADLWVDFLLKETEEREKQREKREASEAARRSQEESQTTTSSSNSSSVQPSQPQANLAPGPSTRQHLLGRPESDFSTVPLATSTYSSVQTSFSRPPPR